MAVDTSAVGASLEIKVDSSEMDSAGARMERLVKSGERAEGAVGTLGTAFERFRDIVKSTVGAVAGFEFLRFVGETITAAARTQELGIGLLAVAKNAHIAASALDASEAALKRSGISAQESRNQMLRLIQAHIDLAKAPDLAKVAANTGIVSGNNTSETFSRLNYAITSGQSEILRDLGLQVNFENGYASLARTLNTIPSALNEVQKVQARTNEVIRVGADFAGLYEAAMQTAGKQMRSTVRYAEDMRDAVGEAYQPLFTKAVFAYAEALKFLGHNAGLVNAVISAVAVTVGVLLVTKLVAAASASGVLTAATLALAAAQEAAAVAGASNFSVLSAGFGALASANPIVTTIVLLGTAAAALTYLSGKTKEAKAYEEEHKLSIEQTNEELAKRGRLLIGNTRPEDVGTPQEKAQSAVRIAAEQRDQFHSGAFQTIPYAISPIRQAVSKLSFDPEIERNESGRIAQTRKEFYALQDLVKSGEVTFEEATGRVFAYVKASHGAWDSDVLQAWMAGGELLNNAQRSAATFLGTMNQLPGEIAAAADALSRFQLRGLTAPTAKQFLTAAHSEDDDRYMTSLGKRERDRVEAAVRTRPLTPDEALEGFTPLSAYRRALTRTPGQARQDAARDSTIDARTRLEVPGATPDQLSIKRNEETAKSVIASKFGQTSLLTTLNTPDKNAAEVLKLQGIRSEQAALDRQRTTAAQEQALNFYITRIPQMDAELAGTKAQTAAARESADAQRLVADAAKANQAVVGLGPFALSGVREQTRRRVEAQQAAERALEFAKQQRQEEIANNVTEQGNQFLAARIGIIGSTVAAQDSLNRQEAIAKFVAQEGENAARKTGQDKIALLTEQYDLQLKLSRAEQETARRAETLAAPWVTAFNTIQQAGKSLFDSVFQEGSRGLHGWVMQMKASLTSLVSSLAFSSIESRITATLTSPGGLFGRDGLASRLKAQLAGGAGVNAVAPEIPLTPEAITVAQTVAAQAGAPALPAAVASILPVLAPAVPARKPPASVLPAALTSALGAQPGAKSTAPTPVDPHADMVALTRAITTLTNTIQSVAGALPGVPTSRPRDIASDETGFGQQIGGPSAAITTPNETIRTVRDSVAAVAAIPRAQAAAGPAAVTLVTRATERLRETITERSDLHTVREGKITVLPAPLTSPFALPPDVRTIERLRDTLVDRRSSETIRDRLTPVPAPVTSPFALSPNAPASVAIAAAAPALARAVVATPALPAVVARVASAVTVPAAPVTRERSAGMAPLTSVERAAITLVQTTPPRQPEDTGARTPVAIAGLTPAVQRVLASAPALASVTARADRTAPVPPAVTLVTRATDRLRETISSRSDRQTVREGKITVLPAPLTSPFALTEPVPALTGAQRAASDAGFRPPPPPGSVAAAAATVRARAVSEAVRTVPPPAARAAIPGLTPAVQRVLASVPALAAVTARPDRSAPVPPAVVSRITQLIGAAPVSARTPATAAGDGFGERADTAKLTAATSGLREGMDNMARSTGQLAQVTVTASKTQEKSTTRVEQFNKLFGAATGGLAAGLFAGQYAQSPGQGGLIGGILGGVQGGLATGNLAGVVVGGLTGLISGFLSGESAKRERAIAQALFSKQFAAALAEFGDAAKGISSSLLAFNLKADLQAQELKTSLDKSDVGKGALTAKKLFAKHPSRFLQEIIDKYDALVGEIAADATAIKALELTNRKKVFTDEIRNLATPEGSNVTKAYDILLQRPKDQASLVELGLDPATAAAQALTLQGGRLSAMLRGISGGAFAALIAALPQLSAELYAAKQQADAFYQAELKQQDIGTYAPVDFYNTIGRIFDIGRPTTVDGTRPVNPYTGYATPTATDPGLGYTPPEVPTPPVTAIPVQRPRPTDAVAVRVLTPAITLANNLAAERQALTPAVIDQTGDTTALIRALTELTVAVRRASREVELGAPSPSGTPGAAPGGVLVSPVQVANPGAASLSVAAPTTNRVTFQITIGAGAIVTPAKNGDEILQQVLAAATKEAARQFADPTAWPKLSPRMPGLL